MILKRRDPAEPPKRALIVTLAVMLVASAAFSADLFQGLTALRLAVFALLVAAALFFFQRGLRKYR